MTQIYKKELRAFARAIMPELYRMQERQDRRRKRKGAVYRIGDEDDMTKIMSLIEKSEAAPNYFPRS